MWKKRKLTRKSLDELAKIMPVLSEDEQRACIGGYGRVVRGTGTAADPHIIQEVFNVTAWSFEKNSEMFANAVSSAVNSFNNQGVHKVGTKYYKLEFVCNILSTTDDYAREHTREATLIRGSSRFVESTDPAYADYEEKPLRLGAQDDNDSGIMTYYSAIEKTFGSGSECLDELKKVIIHEIGHSFGLAHGSSPIMGGFDKGTGTSPGDIDSGAIIKMIENNPK